MRAHDVASIVGPSHKKMIPQTPTVNGRNPAPVDRWYPINNGINHLSTGAGFRNHPQYHHSSPVSL